MYLCLRIDLDYVPWDTPDAQEFGHGEPAVVVRLLDLARSLGIRYQFFASNRVLRAFPAVPEALLNEGHALDWYCKHPEDFGPRFNEGSLLFSQIGVNILGFSVRGPWPESAAEVQVPSSVKFMSAAPGPHPKGLTFFPVETRGDRDTFRGGQSVRGWTDSVKAHLRAVASLNKGATVCIRPQVLARFDPRLTHVRELVELGNAVGLQVRTLRELVQSPSSV
ncbi:MAG: hypothetical protein K1X67_05035 [Fimbriimonadaceae bacterium]|nr:hypothetical protein [Fimbriimonadaceae bacterium]